MEYKRKGVSGGMANESLCAEFPDTWEEFIEQNSFENGAGPVKEIAEAGNRLIDVYRVKQMMWYYLRNYIKLGNAYSSEDYVIDIVPDETKNSIYGTPHFVVRRRF